MNRNEAVLRELNVYPLWVRREQTARAELADEQPQIEVITPAPETEVMPLEIVSAREISHEETPVNLPPTNTVEVEPLQPTSDWPTLKTQVRDCQLCKLRAGCTQTVLGVGDEQADWLFVGEGPGADEDARGEPFVGQAGKLLDNMLAAIQLKRGDNVYIANIVKCRPPENRTPDKDEVAHCLPYLQQQIALIQPKLIVALGKTAANALLGHEATLSSLRNKVYDYHGIPLIITYHPAYLLRSPSEKSKAWQDLCLAVATLSAAVTQTTLPNSSA